MPKKPQASSSRQKLSSYKKFWLIFAGSIIILLSTVLGFSLYETYHDRPLAKGLDYVGREYNSGCLPFRIFCTSPETEYLYYATDINPDEVLTSFSGWRLESKKKGAWEFPKEQAQHYTYNLVASDGSLAAYSYFPDKEQANRVVQLLPSKKQYIIMVNREEYNTLRRIRSD